MASREQDPEAVFIEFISSDIDWSLMRAMYKPVTLSHKSGEMSAADMNKVMNNPPRMPSRSQFVVKVCVGQSSMFVSNEEGSVHGSLYRKAGQEEVYDMLRRQIGARGFERGKAFFSAIYKSDTYEEGCKLEINAEVQIYTKYGQFIRKFGANILQHPRGVCVDNMGRVIVVECKVMRVVIFDHNGNLLKKFGCSQYLHFPNGVVVNDRLEIFISDNRAHCVKVFDYDGNYLRQIGGEGVTNYPIGVGINAKGEITIADNHNNFNLTVYSQEGLLISALESKVKHAQCYDVALMDDGSVVLASKDFKLYIYKYLQVPPIPTGMQM